MRALLPMYFTVPAPLLVQPENKKAAVATLVVHIANMMYQSRFRMNPATQPKLNIDMHSEINVMVDISMEYLMKTKRPRHAQP
ncbi:hypothetical protein ABLB69_19930 [Xenorhabdus khoisanae]|uniref:hypothetical protein n=1 Tax=Xenorhabdus khoisanae TaxID=880157 RepID=UPI0032B82A67